MNHFFKIIFFFFITTMCFAQPSEQQKLEERKAQILKEISEEIETVRNIIISSAMMYVENQGKKLTNQNLEYAIRKIITTTMVSWMQGILKK